MQPIRARTQMASSVHFAGLGNGYKLNNCQNMAKSSAIAGIPISKMMPIQPITAI